MSVFVSPPVLREDMATKDRDASMPETWAASWDALRREYEDTKETIGRLRVETEEEGKERAKREARKRATRRDVEDFDVVRFASATEEADARFYLDTAVDWIPDLDAMFEREVPTLQFLAGWGTFQFCYGMVMASCFRKGDGLKALRTAVKGGESLRLNTERKKRFVAALIQYWMERGKVRKIAEGRAAEAIERYLKNPTPVPGFDVAWFASLVVRETGKETRLKGTYTKHLEKERLRELAIRPRNDLPPLEIFLPEGSASGKQGLPEAKLPGS
jgi:hypothetical protein